MINIQEWLCAYQKAINPAFGNRVLFIGLQGSYARGEATEQSDLDVAPILDRVTMADLNSCKNTTAALPHAELLCGQPGAITTENLSEATARLLRWSSMLICRNRDCAGALI